MAKPQTRKKRQQAKKQRKRHRNKPSTLPKTPMVFADRAVVSTTTVTNEKPRWAFRFALGITALIALVALVAAFAN